jgi:hypothetical protein
VLAASGVGRPAKSAASTSVRNPHFPDGGTFVRPLVASRADAAFATVGVGHPVESLADVGRPDAMCAEYKRPDGVAFTLQVCTNSIEPAVPNSSRHLLAKRDDRAALADEPEHCRPEVAVVALRLPLPRRTERLTGARPRPDWSVVGPPGESECKGPAADPREKMDGMMSSKVICRDGSDVPLIDHPIRDQAFPNQLP